MARPLHLILAAAVLGHGAGLAVARPLEEAVCDGLKSERAKLVESGVRKDMEKGPDWAKSNLDRDKLARIERLIEVEEGLEFRCPSAKPAVVAAPSKEPSGAADDAKGKAGRSEAKAVKSKSKKSGAADALAIDPKLIELLNTPEKKEAAAAPPAAVKKKTAAKKSGAAGADTAGPGKTSDAKKP